MENNETDLEMCLHVHCFGIEEAEKALEEMKNDKRRQNPSYDG